MILPARDRIVDYSAGMENLTENFTDEDTTLVQDIFIDNDSSSDDYRRDLEHIKNQGIEGEVLGPDKFQVLLSSLCSDPGWYYQAHLFSAPLPGSAQCKVDLLREISF